jgi:hypothetical protein
MVCQACGAIGPTAYVAYYWNKAALIVRWQGYIKGELCRSCTHRYFWENTLTSATLGWWGIISMVITPFLIGNNVVRYIVALVKLRSSGTEAKTRPQAPPPTGPESAPAAAPFFLHIGTDAVPLQDGQRIELAGQQLAEVNRNPGNADILGLKNISERQWTSFMPDGLTREIVTGRSIRLTSGMKLDFGAAIGEVR